MRIRHIRSFGLFGMITGILGQLIGLYQAFAVIEEVGDISLSLLMGGLKVSMITTFYGIFIFLLSLLIWFILDFILSRKVN
jgi:biopolymer transport protein ExbB/TolQ